VGNVLPSEMRVNGGIKTGGQLREGYAASRASELQKHGGHRELTRVRQ
jgi:hypothetical protein